MRLGINLGLIALIGILVWQLMSSIQEPIAFKAAKEVRFTAVEERLKSIRSAQELYRDITGEFANNFDTLEHVIKTGKIRIISVYGDADDPNAVEQIRYDTTYEAAIEKLDERKIIQFDSLRYVPFSDQTFAIAADTVTYQSTVVNVVEVGTPIKNFMGMYKDPSYARYDKNYDPEKIIKFGNMSAPNLSGNWER